MDLPDEYTSVTMLALLLAHIQALKIESPLPDEWYGVVINEAILASADADSITALCTARNSATTMRLAIAERDAAIRHCSPAIQFIMAETVRLIAESANEKAEQKKS